MSHFFYVLTNLTKDFIWLTTINISGRFRVQKRVKSKVKEFRLLLLQDRLFKSVLIPYLLLELGFVVGDTCTRESALFVTILCLLVSTEVFTSEKWSITSKFTLVLIQHISKTYFSIYASYFLSLVADHPVWRNLISPGDLKLLVSK